MAKLLFSADWHIRLGQKNVPRDWQTKRFHMLVDELNAIFKREQCDKHIIGGDILDRFAPSTEESELYYELVAALEHPTEIYTGNHEMISKTKSVLQHMTKETSRCNPLVKVLSSIRGVDYDIIDFAELHAKKWAERKSDICFTHVRGAIPPHVVPEIDLDTFKGYKLVVTGDLHSHVCCQESPSGIPFIYPGSPLATSFHRERKVGTHGVLIVDTDTLEYKWIDLGHLPQLIRKTIDAGEELVEEDYDRVVYEVVGDLDDLKQVVDSDLLDKRIHRNVGEKATLELTSDLGVAQELSLYLEQVEKLDVDKVAEATSLFKELVNESNYK